MKKIIIDSAYFNFYRFFATKKWYNYSDERKETSENIAWLDNPIFMEMFEKKWFETITNICQRFKVNRSDIIFAREGSNCWRYAIYKEYKATRLYAKDIHAGGPVFKYVNENLHKRLGCNVIQVSTAEGDDIIAVGVDYINTVYPDCKIIIISGDYDLLQLSDKAEIFELDSKQKLTAITSDNPTKLLLQKIIGGDKSDNIPPIFKGCGKVTVEKLISDPAKLNEMLDKKGTEQYELNKLLVDFNNIPIIVRNEIEEEFDKIFK